LAASSFKPKPDSCCFYYRNIENDYSHPAKRRRIALPQGSGAFITEYADKKASLCPSRDLGMDDYLPPDLDRLDYKRWMRLLRRDCNFKKKQHRIVYRPLKQQQSPRVVVKQSTWHACIVEQLTEPGFNMIFKFYIEDIGTSPLSGSRARVPLHMLPSPAELGPRISQDNVYQNWKTTQTIDGNPSPNEASGSFLLHDPPFSRQIGSRISLLSKASVCISFVGFMAILPAMPQHGGLCYISTSF
jgi:hypothetical protein